MFAMASALFSEMLDVQMKISWNYFYSAPELTLTCSESFGQFPVLQGAAFLSVTNLMVYFVMTALAKTHQIASVMGAAL